MMSNKFSYDIFSKHVAVLRSVLNKEICGCYHLQIETSKTHHKDEKKQQASKYRCLFHEQSAFIFWVLSVLGEDRGVQ